MKAAAAPLSEAGECWTQSSRDFGVTSLCSLFLSLWTWLGAAGHEAEEGREKLPGNVFNYAQQRLLFFLHTKNKEAFFTTERVVDGSIPTAG